VQIQTSKRHRVFISPCWEFQESFLEELFCSLHAGSAEALGARLRIVNRPGSAIFFEVHRSRFQRSFIHPGLLSKSQARIDIGKEKWQRSCYGRLL
jgi:hypothetical protein